MRYLVAPDAFKGTLTGIEAARAIGLGIRAADPQAEIRLLPMADGGEGTLETLARAWPGSRRKTSACSEDAGYLLTADGQTAVVESAAWIGMTLASMRQLPVMQRGSARLGEVLRELLLRRGMRRIVVALGGTATHDGGLGMLMRLGVRVLDAEGRPVSPDLAGLMRVRAVDFSGLVPACRACEWMILSDVRSPLTGRDGATRVFAPQKGLDSRQGEAVEQAICRFAERCQHAAAWAGERPAMQMPCSGAAGGLGFAFYLLGASPLSGAEYIIDQTGFRDALETSDWLITGEGRADTQTLRGKLPFCLAGLARQAGVPVALLAGEVRDEQALTPFFDTIMAVRPDATMTGSAFDHLRRAAFRLVSDRRRGGHG